MISVFWNGELVKRHLWSILQQWNYYSGISMMSLLSIRAPSNVFKSNLNWFSINCVWIVLYASKKYIWLWGKIGKKCVHKLFICPGIVLFDFGFDSIFKFNPHMLQMQDVICSAYALECFVFALCEHHKTLER